MTLILFTTLAPHPLTHELSHQGHTVYEALAVSEVYALADQHPTATIIITADIDPERRLAIGARESKDPLAANENPGQIDCRS
jgi:hypothetical protein